MLLDLGCLTDTTCTHYSLVLLDLGCLGRHDLHEQLVAALLDLPGSTRIYLDLLSTHLYSWILAALAAMICMNSSLQRSWMRFRCTLFVVARALLTCVRYLHACMQAWAGCKR